ncbi:arylcarboxylate reductase [Streptomyces beigongshangae]|uniref:arylcarboxylate reductase n=1 Tax=Streptomyces beigongshangae TaxID=2841597 RepID=UPI001C863F35|nr:arylcarboxylate reductase [Streptomyces sp. REN17]
MRRAGHAEEPEEDHAISPDVLVAKWLDIDIDEWTRKVVRRTFDADDGSPYWLGRREQLDFDPYDITRHEELTAFGPFPLDDLRGVDPMDLVPRALRRPLAGRVWDTGGTTGTPCRVFYTPAMLRHRAVWRHWSFVHEGFAPGRSWLQATPSGPHLIGHGAWEVAELHAGLVYAVDMDSRWVKRLIREGRPADVERYTSHLLDQIDDVLDRSGIDYLNTTPALFAALCRRSPERVAALAGARLSGTQINTAMHRDFLIALDGGICGISYGNTFGNAAFLGVPESGGPIAYMPNYPQVTMAVVRKDDWRSTVAPGANGRVRLTVLHDDLFLPNILERDQAARHTDAGWPCDGVADVRPLQIVGTAPEGLY